VITRDLVKAPEKVGSHFEKKIKLDLYLFHYT
jgi:hypothetical protein